MPLNRSIIISSCFLFFAALLVGCVTEGTGGTASSSFGQYGRTVSAERILESTGGDWDIVEFEREPDASSLHKLARKAVNPKDAVRAGRYVRKYDPREEDIHYRILQIEPAAGGGGVNSQNNYAGMVSDDVGVASSLWPVPHHKPGANDVGVRVASVPKVAVRTSVVKAKTETERPKIASVKVERSAPVVGPVGSFVSDIRFGTHPDKTRMVLDVSEATKFSHEMVAGGKALEITLDGAAWDAGQKLKILNHPFIMGYRAKTGVRDTVLTIKLKEAARVRWATSLPPNDGKGNRLVFDIVPVGS